MNPYPYLNAAERLLFPGRLGETFSLGIRGVPVAAGAGIAFAATVVTWFLVQALLDAAAPLGPRLEAITGFIAIAVLLVVMNWFVHKVYWSEWIGRHHRQRRKLLAQTGIGATVGQRQVHL